MSKLAVYQVGDVEHWIAPSSDDLRAVMERVYGCPPEEIWDDDWPEYVRRLDGEEELTLWMPSLDDIPEDAETSEEQHPSMADWRYKATATAREWAETQGEGMLASTEW